MYVGDRAMGLWVASSKFGSRMTYTMMLSVYCLCERVFGTLAGIHNIFLGWKSCISSSNHACISDCAYAKNEGVINLNI